MYSLKKLGSRLLMLALMLVAASALAGEARAAEWSADQTIDADTTLDSGVTVTENVSLTIGSGKTLTVNNGISIDGGKTLTVMGPGKLVVKGITSEYGGNGVNGTLTVSGGTVEVTGGEGNDNIGGHGVSGTLTVSGGAVTVIAGESYPTCAGAAGVNGNVTVNSGALTVTGGNSSTFMAGNGVNGDIILNGGTVTVRGGTSGIIFYNSTGVSGSVTVGNGVVFTDNSTSLVGDGNASDAAKTALNAGNSLRQGDVVNSWDKLCSALNSSTYGYVWLADNVKYGEGGGTNASGNLTAPTGRDITLDLNGKTIDRNCSKESRSDDGYVIKVEGSLTLTDSGTTGKITGGYTNGGTGGGVHVESSGTFEMKSGAISGNHTVGSGGGVYVKDGTFTMSGGTIKDNTAGAGNYGGGVYVTERGTFNVSGTPVITDNHKVADASTVDDNVYLTNDKVITVADTLSNTASIGVTTATAPTANSAVTITSGLSNRGAAANFTSDNAAYYTELESGEAKLFARTPVTITADSATKEYDGTALTASGAAATGLAPGDTHSFTVVMTADSTITDIGSVDNVIATVDGVAVTTGVATGVGSYLVTAAEGTLRVEKNTKPVVIASGSNSWTYDGALHTHEVYTVTYDGGGVDADASGKVFTLPTGDEVRITPTAAGVKECSDTAAGNNSFTYTLGKSDFYDNVTASCGTLTITEQPTYAVTVTNGTADKTNAVENETVTITANAPETGKRFKEWTGADGLTFTTGSGTSATAAFTMPARAVTLTAAYEDVPSTPQQHSSSGSDRDSDGTSPYTPSVAAAEHGAVNVTPQNPKIGDTVTVTAKPDSGYQLARVTATDAQGKSVPVEHTSGGVTFTQPAGKVKVEVIFATVPTPPVGGIRALASPQKLTVNGSEQRVEAYNIGNTNFFRLRDLAALLSGTAAQFGVSFDPARNAVVLTSGVAYDGAAATLGADMSESAVVSPQTVELDGRSVSLTAYNIGGNNFFGLRELAQFLGCGVSYDEATNTAQITSK